MTAAPIRLLLLEDNPGDARLVQLALADHAPGEFSVTWVERLAEALSRIGGERFDVVLCDLGLPDSAGFATFQAISVRATALPLVVLTGADDGRLGREAIRHGAQDYLVKGESGGALIARTLRYAIERKDLELALRKANETLDHRVAERTRELRTANDLLRESEARFRELAAMSSDFYWESDAEHRLTQHSTPANLKVAPIWRTPLGKRRWEIPYRSPDAASWQAHRALRDAHLSFRDFEFSRLEPDGTEDFLSISGDPMFDESGVFVGYRGVGKDITERRNMENVLRAAEEQFRGLVEQSITGIYILQDGRFAYINPRGADIVGGGSPAELTGIDPLSRIADAEGDAFAENVDRLLVGEERNVTMEFDILRRDGTTIRVGANAARVTHQGRPAIIGLVQDISAKRRAEDEIQRYIKQLKSTLMSVVEVATSMSEMRDPYTAGHERRVAQIAARIGFELGFDADRQEGLRVAGYLHDIGKITIPTEILSKPGKLNKIEYELVQLHVQAGYDVLKNVEFPWPVAQVVLQHHERLDGTGYPQGLKGEAILLEARIMAIADVIEAMSSHRPYRVGLGIEKALAEIERGRGSAYDADAADACLRMFREHRFQLPA